MFVLKDALQVPWDALGKDGGILFNVFHMGKLYCLTKKKKSFHLTFQTTKLF